MEASLGRVRVSMAGYTLYRNDGLGGVLRFTYEGDMDGTSMVELMIGGLVEGRQRLVCREAAFLSPARALL